MSSEKEKKPWQSDKKYKIWVLIYNRNGGII